MTDNERRMATLAAKIRDQVDRMAGRGLNAARIFMAGRIKETLSVPAPRRAVRLPVQPGQRKGAISHYVAVTPATVGAPPRKLSSRLRTSVTSMMVTPKTAVVGTNARANPTRKYPRGFKYDKYHELEQAGMPGSGQHKFIAPTVAQYKRDAALICGRAIRLRRG